MKRYARSFLEAAALANSVSNKRQKVLPDPTFSWASETSDESVRKTLLSFSASVDTVRRGILGLTIDDTVLIPQNFDVCFGETAIALRALMTILKIQSAQAPLTMEPTKYVWCSVFKEQTDTSVGNFRAADVDKRLSPGVLNLMEATEFLMNPRVLVETRPGLDFIRYLICEAHQVELGNKLSVVEPAFKYTSKTQKVFEDSIQALVPNLNDLPKYVSTMLRRIVQKIFQAPEGKKAREAICSIIESFYVNDRSIIARSYNTTVLKRLTAEGHKVVDRGQKPSAKHLEDYKATVKPSISTVKLPVSTEELTVVKSINKQLQTLETQVTLPETLDQKLRKTAAKDLITLYHEKCKSVIRVLTARRQKIHNILKSQRAETLDKKQATVADRQKDRAIPFTLEEWTEATAKFLPTDSSLMSVLTREFKLENGLISFDAINKSFFSLSREEEN
jgi:hypothetical protein